MTMPLLLAVFCLDDIPVKVLEELVDACRSENLRDGSLISLIRDPKQTEFDRGTERPLSAFSSGFKGSSMEDLAQFCRSNFTDEDKSVNIAPWAFIALDQRTVDGEGKDDGERTFILAQSGTERVVSLRLKFADAPKVVPGLLPNEIMLADRLDACKDGVYQRD